jgi:UDP-N-acetylglucosamine--N-acetylmuramyl-(pentapeptide) pyrophosphoryl-undecaprenol N-acetylglucosamine transferase
VHLAGRRNVDEIETAGARVPWVVVGYEDDMRYFYAAADLVVARAGGLSIAEIAATKTPAILVPGRFGGGHQRANALRAGEEGFAVMVEEHELDRLGDVIRDLVAHPSKRRAMSEAAPPVGNAATIIAQAMVDAHG